MNSILQRLFLVAMCEYYFTTATPDYKVWIFMQQPLLIAALYEFGISKGYSQ